MATPQTESRDGPERSEARSGAGRRRAERAARELEARLDLLIPRLRYLIRRHLQYHEARGDLPQGEIEPDELLVEVLTRAWREMKRESPQRVFQHLARLAYQ